MHVSDFEFGRVVYGLLFNPEATPDSSNLQMAVTGSREARHAVLLAESDSDLSWVEENPLISHEQALPSGNLRTAGGRRYGKPVALR